MDLIRDRQSIRNKYLIDLSNYTCIRALNSGTFGKVFQIKHNSTNQFFAAKVLGAVVNEQTKKMTNREISIMIRVQHPTIITFHGYSLHDFDGHDNVTLILDLAKNGSLDSLLEKSRTGNADLLYDDTIRQKILIGIAYGMMHLHRNRVIHRDLKPGNILLDEFFNPHITDFGCSKFYQDDKSSEQTQSYGTSFYMAPEVLKGEKYNGKADVYSFAIIMFQVVTDQVPYPEFQGRNYNFFRFVNKFINDHMRPTFNVPVKDPLKKLIEQCWAENPQERPTFDEIFKKLAYSISENVYDVFEGDEEYTYYLENVDADQILDYLYEISENKDTNEEVENVKDENERLKEKVQNNERRIQSLMEEIRETKDELMKANAKINEIEKCTHAIFVCGYDKFNLLLGQKPNNTSLKGNPAIHPLLKLPFDSSSFLSYSVYDDHSVLITRDGSLLGIGNNMDGRISSSLTKTEISQFTEFSIKDDSGHQLAPISAFCSEFGTLYMFSKISGRGRQLVYCDYEINGGNPVFLDIGDEEPVSLFGGIFHTAAISDKGEVILINRYAVKNSPNSRIAAVSLPDGEKASSVACLEYSVFVLSSNGRVFSSKIESGSNVLRFSPVSELDGYEIVWVSGTCEHFLAVSKEGHAFGLGSNECGQLGLSEETESVSSFTEISSLLGYEIRAAYAGGWHSLFETREGKILSCGSNSCGELLLFSGPSEEYVYSPRETTITGGATFCITGNSISIVFTSIPPSNVPNRLIL